MKNKEIADLFFKIAKLLEIKGENTFRVRAFEKAAQNIENLVNPIEELVANDQLKEIPGIGNGMIRRIKEYLLQGSLEEYEDLKKEIPPELLEISSIPGVGPKTAKLIYETFQIKSIDELEKAAKAHQLAKLPHLGIKSEENILKGIQSFKRKGERVLLIEGLRAANFIIEELKKIPTIKKISVAGSVRRKKETIKDIDILCTTTAADKVMKKFVSLQNIERILAEGPTKSSIIIKEGLQVDLRVVDPSSFGAALQYFTGSKEHNISLRELAKEKQYKINEYGVFDLRGGKEEKIAGLTEEEVYNSLNLQYIPPEMRENRGEIELARKNKIPRLVEEKDIKGDLHVHSVYSDGSATIKEIAEKSISLGYQWIVIADHSQSLKIAKGVSTDNLYRKIDEIKKLNKEYRPRNFKIFCGAEVDILSDGSLDYDDKILSQLDFVIAAIHTGFKQSQEQITSRVISAMQNKYVSMIAHPTGRLLGEREPYAINMSEVLEKAKQTNTLLEINAYPQRLDLYDFYCIQAKQIGIMLGIGTDAHILDQLSYMGLGVAVGRRGWLEKENILNTFTTEQLEKFFINLKKGNKLWVN